MRANSRGSVFCGIVAGAFCVFLGGPAAAQTQQQIDWCMNRAGRFSRDLQISGCTAVIQARRWSGQDIRWAFHGRAYAYYRKDNYRDAIADFSEVIRLNPADAHALNGRCWMRAIVGRELREALDDCNESLRLRANDSATLDSRGFTCLKLGQLNHAIADYDAALALEPNQSESYFGRGVAKLKRGDKDGGNADIAIAKAIQPDIAEEFAKYGIRLDGNVVSIPSPPVIADCARAVAQRKSADDLKS